MGGGAPGGGVTWNQTRVKDAGYAHRRVRRDNKDRVAKFNITNKQRKNLKLGSSL